LNRWLYDAGQANLLNAAVLRRAWPELALPESGRDLGETRFPRLAVA
jgi:hypothetical protein